jgi:hypothetical protein
MGLEVTKNGSKTGLFFVFLSKRPIPRSLFTFETRQSGALRAFGLVINWAKLTERKNISSTLVFFLWLDDRLALQELLDDVASKYVPSHVNIFCCFGGLILTAFFYYRPSVSDALASIRSIMSSVRTDVNRAPCMPCVSNGRFQEAARVTWVTGITLAVCTVSFGVTEYLSRATKSSTEFP